MKFKSIIPKFTDFILHTPYKKTAVVVQCHNIFLIFLYIFFTIVTTHLSILHRTTIASFLHHSFLNIFTNRSLHLLVNFFHHILLCYFAIVFLNFLTESHRCYGKHVHFCYSIWRSRQVELFPRYKMF